MGLQCTGRTDHCSNSHNPPQSQSIVVADGQTVVEGDQVGSSPRKPKEGGKTNLPEGNVTASESAGLDSGDANRRNERTHRLFTHMFINIDMPCYCSSGAARLLYAERERLRTDDNTVGVIR